MQAFCAGNRNGILLHIHVNGSGSFADGLQGLHAVLLGRKPVSVFKGPGKNSLRAEAAVYGNSIYRFLRVKEQFFAGFFQAQAQQVLFGSLSYLLAKQAVKMVRRVMGLRSQVL
jgi:hypothetical protein